MGTMVLNNAAAGWTVLHDMVRLAVARLDIPVNVNVYITHSSLDRSTPLHTDRQDVLVVQCEGRKHWRVFPPLVPMPSAYQERGKVGDVVIEDEVGAPVLETTLEPGDILYVPRGFVHDTTKIPAGHVSGETFSTSLTVGLQTESNGLAYDMFLLCTLFLHGENPTTEEIRALTTAHEFMRQLVPYPGALLNPGADSHSAMKEVVDVVLSVWPTLFPGPLPPPERRRIEKVSRIMFEGHQRVISTYREKMMNTTVPFKYRQALWARKYKQLVHETLGHCGFLSRSFPKKFWLPKHTTHQMCWAKG